ncbi:hypothetical protein QO002_004939 [Pararhizobium capsulatum DSM 1112]|uniref:Methylamine utilization protein MauE n=1 Tax=Pararhizobium capsulatum DSM 1112 TaxID=1121113 RepID=A0ABU0BXP0_9HYPH|nr:MauE/DoxX family redox-associated membrane protein [Pararhizobium capsulatum]MDQ0322733.1 hypothetical protein [Pararhizobium capsulatum DSM 1112]
MMDGVFQTAFPGMVAASATTFTALLFLRAAWHKASDFSTLTGYVADYQLLPEGLVEPVARLLIAAEIATVLLLVLPMTAGFAASLAILLLGTYAAGIAINIGRGRTRIECGCGGPDQPLSAALLVRNTLLAGIAAMVLMVTERPLGIAEAAVALGCGLMAWLIYAVIEQLLANAGHSRLTR